jgi:integrase
MSSVVMPLIAFRLSVGSQRSKRRQRFLREIGGALALALLRQGYFDGLTHRENARRRFGMTNGKLDCIGECHSSFGMTVEKSTTKRSVVRILSIEEARELLHLVAAGFKVEADEREKNSWREKFGAISLTVPPMDLVPVIAVGCFGGVRPEEPARMTWDMVDFERKHIDLPADITKDGDRRIVDMSENLAEWLLPCRKESGPLPPMNFRRKRWVLCRAMNWRDWPDDILRHSYGSYHLAKHRNAALTAEQMGHKNARMLYGHYREVVKEASAIDAYWKLMPEVFAKVIRLNVAA